ncbi:MAG: 3-phosphoshikimate 1-carboxyvinyltransferase [Herpetosiphonaceae bacterium]|nr:3-phosphoshikimate 1-carboxyvinyltransferase [Herpetosiphonaceae bacterium]
MQQKLSAARRLRGTIQVPGDKSISHRAVLFNALAEGNAEITGFLPGADCLSSIACLRQMGVVIEQSGATVRVFGRGLRGLQEPADVLDCGNSGTTLRLLAGLLAGQPFLSVLSGDASLRSRPQGRIVGPLRALGAQLDGRDNGQRAPLVIRGTTIHGGAYELPIASAQVKSALLLAGLTGDAPMRLTGKIASRDHTERMLTAMGIDLAIGPDALLLHPPIHPVFPYPLSLHVPGDPSSATFWWVAAAIHPDSAITTLGVGLNPTRTGALDVLRAMGADITVTNERLEGAEPVGDVTVRGAGLRGTRIDGALIPRLIDEIPVLAVAAAHAVGETVVADADELRAKETDRIATVVGELRALGAQLDPTADGMVIAGGGELHGAAVKSHGDHRLAMALAVASLVAEGETVIDEAEAVSVSYPTFWADLAALRG